MILELLAREDIRLHDASLEILRTVGVRVPHPEMRRCSARRAGTWTRHTRSSASRKAVIERCRRPRASSSRSTGATGKQALFGQGERNYNTSGGQALWLTDDSRERRYACLDDVETAARLGDAPPRITIIGAMSDPHEIPAAYRCVEVAATLLQTPRSPSSSSSTTAPRPATCWKCWPRLRGARRRPRVTRGLPLPGADQPAQVPLQRH